MLSPRYEVSVVILALYLGLLEGPVKLGSGGHEPRPVVRDVLIFAVGLGALLRLVVKKERVRLPPLSAWVLAFVALVLVEAFNPNTAGLIKVLGGFRQQLRVGAVLLLRLRADPLARTRFRRLFLMLGVIALANGVVGTYQTGLGPGAARELGPRLPRTRLRHVESGSGRAHGRTFVVEGEAQVRPPGARLRRRLRRRRRRARAAGTLALLATGRLRRRWPVLLLCLGALVAIATGLGRSAGRRRGVRA